MDSTSQFQEAPRTNCKFRFYLHVCDSRHFRSIRNSVFYFFHKMAAVGGHFAEKCDRKWFSAIQNGSRGHFVNFFKKYAYLSEMARNAIKSYFRSSKMATSCHVVLFFPDKIKVAYWSEMARNAIKSDFQSSKMAAGGHFVNLKK